MIKLIGISGKKGCGKTFAADYLIREFGYTRVKFADPIKSMLKTAGLTDIQLEGEEKETPCELLGGKTPRWAMQTLGTEWGRTLIHENLWVDLWRSEVERLLNGQTHVVVDDLRFNNELSVVKSLGGVTVKIHSPSVKLGDHHSSENSVLKTDYEVINPMSKGFFEAALDALLIEMSDEY
jgi:hypothetical protein